MAKRHREEGYYDDPKHVQDISRSVYEAMRGLQGCAHGVDFCIWVRLCSRTSPLPSLTSLSVAGRKGLARLLQGVPGADQGAEDGRGQAAAAGLETGEEAACDLKEPRAPGRSMSTLLDQ